MIAGFAKCGTTALHHYLGQHPGIFLTVPKEPRFFSDPDIRGRMAEYQARFLEAQPGSILGEASVSYSETAFVSLCAQRISTAFPNIKLILLIRDPITRIESQFRELHDSSYKLGISCPMELHDAIYKFPNIICDSQYFQIVNRWTRHIPRKNILLLFNEELRERPSHVLKQALDFLEIQQLNFEFDLTSKPNSGATKYRDTKKFRQLKRMRAARIAESGLNQLPFEERERFKRKKGWRVPFGSQPIVWSDDALKTVVDGLKYDVEGILELTKRDSSIWPRFQAAADQMS